MPETPLNWRKRSENKERGTLGYVTPRKTLSAARLVTSDEVYEFRLVGAPLNLSKGLDGPITPLAIS